MKQAQKYISCSKYYFTRLQISNLKMSFPISTTKPNLVTAIKAIAKVAISPHLEFIMIPLLIHSHGSDMTKLFYY